MNIQIYCPSKTFWVGEYAILSGAPATLLATQPCFRMTFQPRYRNLLHLGRIHPLSPAGRWIKRYAPIFKRFRMNFLDPHRQKGGFGASTSQYLMAWYFSKVVHGRLKDGQITPGELLNDYLSVAWNGEGTPPSGADLITQFYGQMTSFYKSSAQVTTQSWPFEQLGFFLYRTGEKIPTHVHLQDLTTADFIKLGQISEQFHQALADLNETAVIARMHDFQQQLQRQGLVARHTQELLEQMSLCPGIVAAKGCGALGADVILVIYHMDQKASVADFMKDLPVKWVADQTLLSPGLTLQEEVSNEVAS